MVLVPPGAVGLKFWRPAEPDTQPAGPDTRIADAWSNADKSAIITLSNSDKTATVASGLDGAVRSTRRCGRGKLYAEFAVNAWVDFYYVGIKNSITSIIATNSSFHVIATNGNIVVNGTVAGNLGFVRTSNVVSVAWDADGKLVWFRNNGGNWNNSGSADPATGAGGFDTSSAAAVDHALWFMSSDTPQAVTLRTELADFTYSVPSGFTSWMGEVLPEITGVGDLAADVAAVSGDGTVGSAAAVGDGVLVADAAAVSGSGVSASTGTGALAAQTAAVAGAGASASIGSGALVAQAATASGAGAIASVGTGALAAQAATVTTGAGLSGSVGAGALQAASATVVGAGISSSAGTGSLVAGSAEVAGAGTAAAANSGALVGQAATVTGLGISASTGSGALQAGAAAIAGAGLVASVGTGALIAGAATVAGAGEVIAAGAAVGTGVLVGGAATLSGEGEVTGEVAPPVSVGGGYWRWQRRPVAVEGIGYAILPQLEGEAHGLVGTDADGVATLSGVVGAGVGAVGVIGRSAARLAIKAAAIADSGPAGSGAGVITLKGAAIGRYDDDEAAMVALLLAA